MQSDIFRAGVSPGAPATEDEIKMLLCYILSNIPTPMSFAQLYEALGETNLINYFELVRALDRLVELGHLDRLRFDRQATTYTTTAQGKEAAQAFERSLPLTVREKALDASEIILERERRLTEVSFKKHPCEGGFLLELSIPDDGGELISFQVFCPTAQQCEQIRRRFLNAPVTIYKGVMALLTGDDQVLGDIFGQERPLF